MKLSESMQIRFNEQIEAISSLPEQERIEGIEKISMAIADELGLVDHRLENELRFTRSESTFAYLSPPETFMDDAASNGLALRKALGSAADILLGFLILGDNLDEDPVFKGVRSMSIQMVVDDHSDVSWHLEVSSHLMLFSGLIGKYNPIRINVIPEIISTKISEILSKGVRDLPGHIPKSNITGHLEVRFPKKGDPLRAELVQDLRKLLLG